MHRQVEYESPEIISHILYAFRRRDRKEKCEKKKKRKKLGMGMKGVHCLMDRTEVF